ncbi:hypothetical protein OE88DRAFT_1648601 [Heliocybe sulcata]|uniref:Uncharacterized protein n=1 Tax=Heliocybe sulcata TaxID=5364 RepID=A0A5C3MN54_9AGAM|nr:hypothetical protein OE88DRAFT_1648601 [Heliocybe sulcata]
MPKPEVPDIASPQPMDEEEKEYLDERDCTTVVASDGTLGRGRSVRLKARAKQSIVQHGVNKRAAMGCNPLQITALAACIPLRVMLGSAAGARSQSRRETKPKITGERCRWTRVEMNVGERRGDCVDVMSILGALRSSPGESVWERGYLCQLGFTTKIAAMDGEIGEVRRADEGRRWD